MLQGGVQEILKAAPSFFSDFTLKLDLAGYLEALKLATFKVNLSKGLQLQMPSETLVLKLELNGLELRETNSAYAKFPQSWYFTCRYCSSN